MYVCVKGVIKAGIYVYVFQSGCGGWSGMGHLSTYIFIRNSSQIQKWHTLVEQTTGRTYVFYLNAFSFCIEIGKTINYTGQDK